MGRVITFSCRQCGEKVERPAGHVNRARASGLNLYCGRACSGLGSRTHKTRAQKVAEKKAYDALYRQKNIALLTAKKAAYHLRTYDPAAAAKIRKLRMPYHVEYCRRPEYREWKRKYDEGYNAKRNYGPFADAFRVCIELNHEIKERMTNEEICIANGTFAKRQTRARANGEKATRDRHRTAFGGELA